MRRVTRSVTRNQPIPGIPTVDIPPELISMIVDYLEDDRPSLKACSLVNNAWSQRARELLYREVFLGPPKPHIRCKQLRKVFQAHPRLAKGTRTLAIVERAKSVKTDFADGWLVSSKEIASLLPLFTSLEEIQIVGDPEYLNWGLVPVDTREAFFDLFSRPHVKTIILDGIFNMQITPLVFLPHLEVLEIRQVEVYRGEEDAFLPLNKPSRIDAGKVKGLRALDVCDSPTALDVFFKCLEVAGPDPRPDGSRAAVLDLQRLEELWLCTTKDEETYPGFETVAVATLKNCSNVTFYSLTLDHGFSPTVFEVNGFRNLTTFCIHFTIDMIHIWSWNDGEGGKILEGLEALSVHPSPPPLQRFGLMIESMDPKETGIDFDTHVRNSFVHRTVWLRHAAHALAKFPKLQSVYVMLEVSATGTVLPPETWRDFVREVEGQLSPITSGKSVTSLDATR
ncbi:hypothetical protein CC1G_08230 [Coprinopsis cinerea okayama7|uniref:Uncharacterized protein n=1 Tax=Coprinopsis cinerea (strain Okayama-7 / 130 / ATCC MYA-4618 / FGSC 9003) TaxID=240176 RepID=A8P7H8_COPC7|nr:hypothetical protein CC1G_08230 [Coprinopsis cinerea okayama7\|eukprot:XP_001839363.2 hypothetical protein CC1G_08230 [Coprinopsis cinerea okayama7\